MRNVDITGRHFGRLLAIQKSFIKNKDQYWECRCSCGNTTFVKKGHLTSGRIKSCGCLLKENNTGYKHGLSHSKILRIFQGMLNRCYNKKEKAYKNYGARGITICKEWLNNRLNFYYWAISNGYKDGLTIERIDNNKGYSPDNCKWDTYKQQARNTRRNLIITYKEKSLCLATWCEKLGLDYRLTEGRLRRGWSVERAFNTKGPLSYWSRR